MVTPIRNNVLVKPFMEERISLGGIITPESFHKESDRCKIVAVGGGTKSAPMKLKAGQIGYRVGEWGTPIEENGELFYLMEDNAIIALG